VETSGDRFVQSFREKTKEYIERIEAGIEEEFKKYSWSRFYGPLNYALDGGKRVRPLIVLLAKDVVHNSFRKDNGEQDTDAVPAAVAVELLHTESIIHDDIIDQDAVRRERTAFHIKYGVGASILTADFVLGMILSIASRYGNSKVAEELSLAALRMSEGQFTELKIDPSVYSLKLEEYITIISQKTAALFQCAAKLGGLIGIGTQDEARSLSNFGLDLGIAYQIQDDLLDWGKKGKVTEALRATPRILREKSTHYAKKAQLDLESLRSSEAKSRLNDLAEFAILRQY
jgi:octaprenyl-diphosphate synthase